jgi:uncharacterized membrane protein YecN with MAPEG domain
MFTPPVVTALTAGILILMQMALLFAVVRARRRNRQSLGDGGHAGLLMAVRRHGNLAENAALFVAGFALLEMFGGNRIGLAIMCAAFVLARISHAVGLSMQNTVNPFRVFGTAATVVVGMVLGLDLVRVALGLLLA